MSEIYLTTDELSQRIKYDARTIRNRLKDSVLLEGIHYFRPFGGRKILFIWEAVERDMVKFSRGNGFGIPMANGGVASRLAPTDGSKSIGIGGSYTKDNMKISGGVSYAWIGDAQTEAPAPYPAGTTFGQFTDNTTVGVGVRVGFTF